MKRCLIVAGADIGDYGRIKNRIEPDDFIICCDSGLKHCAPLGIEPDLIIGDFDSWENPHSDTETIVLPVIKDDTDSAFAVKEALKRGFEDFLLIGVFGGRLDHTLGNIGLLLAIDTAGKKATALDDFSEVTIAGSEPSYITDDFGFFSLLSVDGVAGEITITGAKYPLENASIGADFPLGVSNEVLPGETACVTVGKGRLALFRIFK